MNRQLNQQSQTVCILPKGVLQRRFANYFRSWGVILDEDFRKIAIDLLCLIRGRQTIAEIRNHQVSVVTALRVLKASSVLTGIIDKNFLYRFYFFSDKELKKSLGSI